MFQFFSDRFFFLMQLCCLLCFGNAFSQETRILYIRHGEVPGNDPNPATYIYTGSRTDDSLTEKGRAQAAACAMRIADLKITAVYASTLKRAMETAELIAQKLGLEVQLRQNLREIDWGCADGQLVQRVTEKYKAIESQIALQYPERKERWDHLPVFEGAETYNVLLKRTMEELAAIAELHKGETIVVVGHGRVLKTLIADLRDSEENPLSR